MITESIANLHMGFFVLFMTCAIKYNEKISELMYDLNTPTSEIQYIAIKYSGWRLSNKS